MNTGAQEPVHEITCYPATESEESSVDEEPGIATMDSRQTSLQDNELQSHPTEDIKRIVGQNEGGPDGSVLDLGSLPDDVMDEIVSSMIRQTSLGDPDVDFLGLDDNEETIKEDEGNFMTGERQASKPSDGNDEEQKVTEQTEL